MPGDYWHLTIIETMPVDKQATNLFVKEVECVTSFVMWKKAMAWENIFET